MSEQKIKCKVETCQYNNPEKCLCELKEIQVGCMCGCHKPTSTDETVCNSYECCD